MTGSDSTAHVTAHGAAGWRGIRTLGPLLLIVFGLVLVFAPMTTIGPAGSVGNAGAVASKAGDEGGAVPGCPTQDQIDSLIAQRLAYDANPDNYIGVPMSLEDLADLVANCSCDEPHSSGGNAGNAAIVDPCERPDVEPPAEPEDNEPPVEPEDNEPPVEPEENEPPAEPDNHEPAAPIAAEPSESEPAAPAPAPMDELPQTGNRGQIATTAVGFLLASLGVVLLVTSRRRTADPLG